MILGVEGSRAADRSETPSSRLQPRLHTTTFAWRTWKCSPKGWWCVSIEPDPTRLLTSRPVRALGGGVGDAPRCGGGHRPPHGPDPTGDGSATPRYRLRQLVGYFLYLGAAGFGGPVALVEYMHRDLVELRGWISEDEYREGLALANLSRALSPPSSPSTWGSSTTVRRRRLVGVAFVAPSFLMVVAIGWAYVRFGGLSWMQAVFYGVGAAIIGIIAWSAYRLTRKTMGRDPLLWVIFVAMAAITAITETERIELFPLAGLAVWAARSPRFRRSGTAARPSYHCPRSQVLRPPRDSSRLGEIFWFFFKAGAFVFGSGLAIVPFLYGGVVGGFGWLDAQQFVDAVAVAMITPGPS